MKAMIFSIIRIITAAFVLALMFLTLEVDNIIHVILSFPIFLGVLYIGIEGLSKSNKLNKEKEVN
nr:MAG TPA: hypothetical protein [Caudoviricetes sp.]